MICFEVHCLGDVAVYCFQYSYLTKTVFLLVDTVVFHSSLTRATLLALGFFLKNGNLTTYPFLSSPAVFDDFLKHPVGVDSSIFRSFSHY